MVESFVVRFASRELGARRGGLDGIFLFLGSERRLLRKIDILLVIASK